MRNFFVIWSIVCYVAGVFMGTYRPIVHTQIQECPHYLTVPQSDLHYLIEGNFDYTCTKVKINHNK